MVLYSNIQFYGWNLDLIITNSYFLNQLLMFDINWMITEWLLILKSSDFLLFHCFTNWKLFFFLGLSGLSWLFGYLAISDARLPFQYIFTVLNSLQGFFIFILFVVRKKKVREQWYIMCCKGMDREKVSRSLSASNSIPSSYSNGSNRSNSKNKGQDRDRSDSTKTVTSTFSNGSLSNGFTNYGYDKSFDVPYNRRTYRNF